MQHVKGEYSRFLNAIEEKEKNATTIFQSLENAINEKNAFILAFDAQELHSKLVSSPLSLYIDVSFSEIGLDTIYSNIPKKREFEKALAGMTNLVRNHDFEKSFRD